MGNIEKNAYKHCSSSFSSIPINSEHSTSIRVELMNKLRLILKHMVVLTHKVSPNLHKETN